MHDERELQREGKTSSHPSLRENIDLTFEHRKIETCDGMGPNWPTRPTFEHFCGEAGIRLVRRLCGEVEHGHDGLGERR